MEQVQTQNVELSDDQQIKKSQVQAFIRQLEKNETDPEYRKMMENYNRVKREYNEFLQMPAEQRSKILFGIQCQIIRHEVDANPDSPYNWQHRRGNDEKTTKIAISAN